MSTRVAAGRSKTLTVLAILLAMVCMVSITACRDSEPPPEPEMDTTAVDRSAERRRQAHMASEGGPQRTGSDDEPAFQGPVDGDVGAAGYGEGYKPPGDADEEDREAEDDEAEEEPREP